MERHHRGVWQLVSAIDEESQNLVLSGRITCISFEHQSQWSETIALRIRKGCIQFHEQPNARWVESFTCSHDDAGHNLCAVLMEPARAPDFSLKHRTIEGVLIVACAKLGTRTNDFQSA